MVYFSLALLGLSFMLVVYGLVTPMSKLNFERSLLLLMLSFFLASHVYLGYLGY